MPKKQTSFSYELVRSSRRTVAVQIKRGGRVIVRAPHRMPLPSIQAFVERQTDWIREHIEIVLQREQQRAVTPSFSPEEIAEMTAQARILIPARTAMWANRMGLGYGRITIRHQRTRWGSCSGKKNLNFNCLLVCVPEAVMDYVIVHELCHLTHMDHSEAFWQSVEGVIPNYRIARTWLKKDGAKLIERIKKV